MKDVHLYAGKATCCSCTAPARYLLAEDGVARLTTCTTHLELHRGA